VVGGGAGAFEIFGADAVVAGVVVGGSEISAGLDGMSAAGDVAPAVSPCEGNATALGVDWLAQPLTTAEANIIANAAENPTNIFCALFNSGSPPMALG